MFDVLVIGCGLCGMVVARELADRNIKVHIIEKRNHIGGNIFDYIDKNGILVQKYGPHVFFTDNPEIEKYVTRFVPIDYFYAECRTYINGMAIPIPFNFASIDMIYDVEKAGLLKKYLKREFGEKEIVSAVDIRNSNVSVIHEYGMFIYEHEYRKYSAKQWGMPIEKIDSSIFMRVPVYLSYFRPYTRQKYQYMPQGGFTNFAHRLINHKNISFELDTEALIKIKIDINENKILCEGKEADFPVVYTGPLDELFEYNYGKLPYRSLEFVWKTVSKENILETPLSAFPEGDKYTRITDYTQFPLQKLDGKSVIAIEFPVEYDKDSFCGNEPYYPVLTQDSKTMFSMYEVLAKKFRGLYPCGRLADFKYYNMDAVIERAWNVAETVIKNI